MAWSVRSIPLRYHTLTLSPPHLITANLSALYILVTTLLSLCLVTRSFSSSLTTFFVSSSLLPYLLLPLCPSPSLSLPPPSLSLSLYSLFLYSQLYCRYPPISSSFLGSSLSLSFPQLFSLLPSLLSSLLLPLSSHPLLLPPSPPTLSSHPSHSSQESDAQAVSTEVGQLDLLEAGPAEDGSEQAEQVRLFLAGEHDIMQKVFAGQEKEEEKRGTQVEIEVRTFCIIHNDWYKCT